MGLPTGVGVREAGAARFAGGVTSEAADAAGDAAAGPGFMGVTGGATGSAVEGGATGSGVGSPACSSFDSAEDSDEESASALVAGRDSWSVDKTYTKNIVQVQGSRYPKPKFSSVVVF